MALVSGCSSAVLMFPGSPRSQAEIATVDLKGAAVVAITDASGRSVEPADRPENWPSAQKMELQFLPGRYSIRLRVNARTLGLVVIPAPPEHRYDREEVHQAVGAYLSAKNNPTLGYSDVEGTFDLAMSAILTPRIT